MFLFFARLLTQKWLAQKLFAQSVRRTCPAKKNVAQSVRLTCPASKFLALWQRGWHGSQCSSWLCTVQIPRLYIPLGSVARHFPVMWLEVCYSATDRVMDDNSYVAIDSKALY